MVDAQKTFLITGVSSGLGAAFARAALAEGHRVIGMVRQAEQAEAFAAGHEGRATAQVVDLSDRAAVEGLIDRIDTPIDVLVNNAGYGHEGTIEESPLDAMRDQFEINVFAPVALIKAVLPGMRARRSGRIINITSIAAAVAFPGIAYYCGSKFALDGISEALAKEVRPFGIFVTAAAPGQFRTDWAGRSMRRSPRSIPDYDAGFDPLRTARQAKSGQQPGDPDRAAAALMALVASDNPPTRLFLGSDALMLAGQKVKRLQAELSAWDALSRSTDFPAL